MARNLSSTWLGSLSTGGSPSSSVALALSGQGPVTPRMVVSVVRDLSGKPRQEPGSAGPPFHTCLGVTSSCASSCPSALGLFRFGLQSATELNLPSETSPPRGGRHRATRHLSCSCGHIITGASLPSGMDPTGNSASRRALMVRLQIPGHPPPRPPSWRTLGCFSTRLIHTHRMKVLAGSVSLFPHPTPICPFFFHFLILDCTVSQQLPLGKNWERQVYQKSLEK